MSRYESIDTGFWTHPDFDHWTADALLLYAWLITNAHSHGLSGIYEVSDRTIRQETRLSPKRLEAAWNLVSLKVDRTMPGWVWVKNRTARQTFATLRHVVGLVAHLRKVPCALAQHFAERYPNLVAISTDGVPTVSPRCAHTDAGTGRLRKDVPTVSPHRTYGESVPHRTAPVSSSESSLKAASFSSSEGLGGTKDKRGPAIAEKDRERQRAIAKLLREAFPENAIPAGVSGRNSVVDVLGAHGDYDREYLVRGLCLDAERNHRTMAWLASVLAHNRYRPPDDIMAEAKGEMT